MANGGVWHTVVNHGKYTSDAGVTAHWAMVTVDAPWLREDLDVQTWQADENKRNAHSWIPDQWNQSLCAETPGCSGSVQSRNLAGGGVGNWRLVERPPGASSSLLTRHWIAMLEPLTLLPAAQVSTGGLPRQRT